MSTATTERTASGVLVGGEWRRPADPVPVYDKFTRRPAALVHRARPEDVSDAVDAAARAAVSPPAPAQRAEILERAAELVELRAHELRDTYVAETGFTLADADTEISRAAGTLRLSAQEAVRIAGEEIPVGATPGSEGRLAFTIRVPVGVVGAIAPFNAPLNTVAHKVAPALAAGNAVVLKPAEATPLCSIALAEILAEAGLPEGLLNLVCGPGASVGEALLSDPRVRYFTFTGSTAVGLRVKQRSGIARVHLELGANSAAIVAADADLKLVCDLVARAGYRKAGQVCTSVQRLLVEHRVLDELAERLSGRVRALRAGDPRAKGVQVGPMISPQEAERATDWVREARDSGAAVLAGGEREGALLEPTLLLDPAPGTRVMNEEIFAPVVALVGVGSVHEAVELVNRGRYGLQAGVFTRDLDLAFDAARRLRVGGVMINDTSSYHADAMPYGGVKDSGIGLEGPHYAVQDMTEPRIVVLNLREPRT